MKTVIDILMRAWAGEEGHRGSSPALVEPMEGRVLMSTTALVPLDGDGAGEPFIVKMKPVYITSYQTGGLG